jgi:AcrR family transcriptional regulator
VSRRTFYEHFASREDCYIALLDLLNEQLIARIAHAVDPQASIAVQVRQAIEAWIAGSMVRPELTLSWIRDAPSLQLARAIQIEAQRRFVALIARIAAGPILRDQLNQPPEALMIILVGGLRELIATQVEDAGSLTDITDVAVTATLAIIETLQR